MTSMNRRLFLQSATAAGVLWGARPIQADKLDRPLGFMLHALRAEAAKDFPGTLAKVAALGLYSEIELVSFKGFSAASTRDGFGPLAPMAVADIRRIVRDAGFRTRSCHFKYSEFAPDVITQTIDWAQGVGTEYMTIGDVAPTATLEDWKAHFERLNRYGELVSRAGMTLGLHTQNDVWRSLDGGAPILDRLLAAVDPTRCRIQIDLSSVQAMKVDAPAYLRRYPGRVFALHLRDAKTPQGTGYLPSVPLGQGDVDWRALLAAAKAANVPHYIVEMQTQGQMDPVEALRISGHYIRNLDF